MYTTIVILVVIAAILMCLIVLVQESKGGGLASSVSDANNLLGVHKTTDVVEKTTWALAAIMIVLSVVSVIWEPKSTGATSVMDEQNPTEQAANPTNVPGMPQSQQAAGQAAKGNATAQPQGTQQAAPQQATKTPAK